MKVMATFMPVYDIAVHIGGDLAEVRLLLPPGASPHTYEPTIRDSMAMEDSAIVFKLGLSLDDWIDKALKSSESKTRKIIVISKGIDLIPLDGEECKGCGGKHDHSHDGAKGSDPHVWMDPVLMKTMAANVRDAYMEALPDKKEIIVANYEKYVKMLDELDRDYREKLSKYKVKDFVTFHALLNYTARRYGLNQVDVIVGFAGKEPEPRHLIAVIEKLKKTGVKTVLAEPQFSTRASESIASEIGGKVVIIDPIGSLSDPERNTYEKNMRKNLQALEEAFQKDNPSDAK